MNLLIKIKLTFLYPFLKKQVKYQFIINTIIFDVEFDYDDKNLCLPKT